MAAATGPPMGVISFVNAESGRVLHRGRPRAARGDRAPRRHRGRERAALRGALDDRAHAAARAAAAGAAGDPGLRARHALPARRAQENWVGGDFYDAFAVARRLDGGGRRRRRPRRPGGLADRLQPPRAADRGAAARRPARRGHVPQPPALRAAGPGAVHALLRAAARARRRRRGDRDLRRPPAAVRDPPRRHARADRGVGHDARRLDDGRVPAHDDDARRRRAARALHRRRHRHDGRRASATARSGCRRLLTDAREPDEALRRIEDGLADFEHGDQADDTCALAIGRLPLARRPALSSARRRRPSGPSARPWR